MAPPIEPWRHVWREGIAPLLDAEELAALADALRNDRAGLVQGWTTWPIERLWDASPKGACAMCYASWRLGRQATVQEVENHFADLYKAVNKRLGKPFECLRFTRWYDDTPRAEMIALLLPEVKLALAGRIAGAA